MRYVITRNATRFLITADAREGAEAPGANIWKSGIYILLLWLGTYSTQTQLTRHVDLCWRKDKNKDQDQDQTHKDLHKDKN